MDVTKNVGRRERKLAQTRVDLAAALQARIAERTMEEVSVRELCDAVDISEATFFNHFPSKADLAVYVVQLWSVGAGWHVAAARDQGARAAIEALLDATAAEVSAHPRVMAEIIAFQARMPDKPVVREVTPLELALAFPDRAGAEALPARGLDGILPDLIELAVTRGELPAAVDRQAAFLAEATAP